MSLFEKENQIINTWQLRKRNAYNIDWTAFDEPIDHVIYIPVNRLSTPYQTEKATNWDKVHELVHRMELGEALAPIIIGYDHDIHDGHHRQEASKIMNYTHVPCVVGGNNFEEIARAREAYQELWKSITPQITKAVLPDPSGTSRDPFAIHNEYMYRGVGLKELNFIQANGYIQSKGKGNDADKDHITCFSHLYSQAEGYARSNYDLYKEPSAFIIVYPKPHNVEEDEHGEIIIRGKVPITASMRIIPIPPI